MQPDHQIAELGELVLENGEVIKNLRMSYVTHGTLNAAKDNAILFMHGFSGNHHMADYLIGPGKPLDTEHHFIISSDSLGNTQTGFEHSTSPTSSGLKMAFPEYNRRDMVNAEYKLITEGLGLMQLLAAMGISMRVVSIDSPAGHAICCDGDPQATWVMGEAIRGFLRELTAGAD
jgi:homoserine O-acetyltransferase